MNFAVFLVDNFRKFPKKSQNVTIYPVTIYTSRLYKFWRKCRVLTDIFGFIQKLDFWPKSRIKGRATNFGGGQDGREFLVFFRTGEYLLGKNWTCDKKVDGRQIFLWWTGEPELSPVLLYGVGVWFLTNISIFDQNVDLWVKLRFLTNISIFNQNFNFWLTFQFSTLVWIFHQVFYFWRRLRFWQKIQFFSKNLSINSGQWYEVGDLHLLEVYHFVPKKRGFSSVRFAKIFFSAPSSIRYDTQKWSKLRPWNEILNFCQIDAVFYRRDQTSVQNLTP